MRIDEEAMACRDYLFYGSLPGQPLPPVEVHKVVRPTLQGKSGDRKELPNVRLVPRKAFEPLADIPALYQALFGAGD